MRKLIAMTIFILLVLGIINAQAETASDLKTEPPHPSDTEKNDTKTIYSWIDSNGTQHFSNKPPPEGANNVKLIKSRPSPPDTVGTDQSEIKKRQAFEQMVEKTKAEARELEKEQKAQKAAAAAEKQNRARKALRDRVLAERKKLQNEIDAINARGLSPTFSQGMKDASIRKVQERIDKLEKNPDAYFQSE